MQNLIGKTIKHIEIQNFFLYDDDSQSCDIITFTCTDGTEVKMRSHQEFDLEETSDGIMELESDFAEKYRDANLNKFVDNPYKEWGLK